jgi:hypothetical protein
MMIARKPRIYIAGPYSLGDVAANVRHAIEAGDKVLCWGGVPFIPHLTHLWHMMYPHEHQEWMEYDRQWLVSCMALWRLPGGSDGTEEEVADAKGWMMPVFDQDAQVEEFIKSYAYAWSK